MRQAGLFFGAVLSIALLASCRSTPPDRVVSSPQEQDVAKLDSMELRLLELRLSPDASALAAFRVDLQRAASSLSTNRLLCARATGLQARAALLAGDLGEARRDSDAAAALSRAEEGAWIVRAALEGDSARRLAILEQGLARSDRKPLLLCERGEELYRQGRYGEAAQDLDEGLRGLDDRYRALYGQDRERALAMTYATRGSRPDAPIPQAEDLAAALTLQEMVERAFSVIPLLGALSSKPHPTYEDVRVSVEAAGLLLPQSSPRPPEVAVTRKDVAFFLWGIVLRGEHNPKLTDMYRRKYSTSPVPDAPVEAPWFEATLGVVEREIMDLPDGTHFQPEGTVSGLEYLQMLNKVQKLFP